MKAYLMFREGDTNTKPEFSYAPDALESDLELHGILNFMSGGDKTIYNTCEDAMLRPLQSTEAILYRQAALRDAIKNPEAVRRLYAIAAAADQNNKYFMSATRLAETFANAVELLKKYTKMLKDLREVADRKLSEFESEGFRKLFEMLRRELTDDFFAGVQEHLDEMRDVDNILVSAKLGPNLMSVDYTLRRKEKGFWLKWNLAPSFSVNAEKGAEELEDIRKRRERAISETTSVMTQSTMFLQGFFNMLRAELAFYAGCLTLIDKMKELGMPICIPTVKPLDSRDRSWRNLYDVSLALTKSQGVIGNDLDAAGKRLYFVTGANQGGKSTFLRSFGQAQLMAQCGMPVGAESYTAPIRRGVFTHFKREEESWMKSGRLDEELTRMSKIVDHLDRGALVLMNESFSSTNEREGSEIACQITSAMIENDVEVFSVTHLYTYAIAYINNKETQYLRAQRRDDAERTFKVQPGEPLETAFGEDLYQKIFVQQGITM
jgi:DNA mismatch repair ATPase MutS